MKATNLSNLMMQLRKACAHPYLNQEDIEDKTVGHEEMHKRLTEGSAKLSFLKLLLPKLFQKGHRILLFSGVRPSCSAGAVFVLLTSRPAPPLQFVIALDIRESSSLPLARVPC